MSYNLVSRQKRLREFGACSRPLSCLHVHSARSPTRRRKSRLRPLLTRLRYRQGNSPYLVGHAFGSQGYTCLPTSTGGTAWNPTARPEATLFTDLFGQQFQIITHFQSINENPKPSVSCPPQWERDVAEFPR